VYAIVIPIENMPVYGGDWIVWFAEREPKPGETPLIYAPMPFRKLEPAEEAAAGNRLRQRIQVAAIIGADGKLNNITLVTKVGPAVEHAATQDIAAWEFKPATRNGVPVDVEVVIEIPFNLPLAAAASPLP
jgi:TonB family protein